jgi:hypothetical protein
MRRFVMRLFTTKGYASTGISSLAVYIADISALEVGLVYIGKTSATLLAVCKRLVGPFFESEEAGYDQDDYERY